MFRYLTLLSILHLLLAQAAIGAPLQHDGDRAGVPLAPAPPVPADSSSVEFVPGGSRALRVDLRTALEWTLGRNPDLVAIRQNLQVSHAAWMVAQRFPTTLNPTVSVDVQPWTFERNMGQGSSPEEAQITVSWAQPIELGRRTGLRSEIAQAAFNQTQWNILQAELSALVQTYRLYQGAVYRREKTLVAERLAAFNRDLVIRVQRQVQANQVTAADAAMAEVENQSMEQQMEAARQEYTAALADLCQQIGVGEYAGCLEASGLIQVPEGTLGGAEHLVCVALASRPEVHAAEAQVCGSRAAIRLAQADRIPIPSVGPVYQKDETGTTFYGLTVSSPVPVLNAGRALVGQREAEYRRDLVALEQTRQRISNQVRSALVKWFQAQEFVTRTRATLEPIKEQASRIERLYAAGQTDLIKLLQVRQRLIQAENTELDAIWLATQAYANLLSAVGTTPLLGSIETEPLSMPIMQ